MAEKKEQKRDGSEKKPDYAAVVRDLKKLGVEFNFGIGFVGKIENEGLSIDECQEREIRGDITDKKIIRDFESGKLTFDYEIKLKGTLNRIGGFRNGTYVCLDMKRNVLDTDRITLKEAEKFKKVAERYGLKFSSPHHQ